jgi:hypothetical protein
LVATIFQGHKGIERTMGTGVKQRCQERIVLFIAQGRKLKIFQGQAIYVVFTGVGKTGSGNSLTNGHGEKVVTPAA